MRLFKLITGCLVLLIIGVFIYQNLATFNAFQDFKLNFYFESSSGKVALYVLLILSAAIGFIIGIAVMLKPYLNLRRALAQTKREPNVKASPAKVETKNQGSTAELASAPVES
jgi:uncharacterized integral membrane protein